MRCNVSGAVALLKFVLLKLLVDIDGFNASKRALDVNDREEYNNSSLGCTDIMNLDV